MGSRTDLAAVAESLEQLTIWLRRLAPNTLSTSTITTIATLLADGPLRVSELAEREAISQPGMTMLVNRLEAAGLAERFADPTDRRASLVRATEAGRAMVLARRAARRDAVRAELERLDPDARAALAAAVPAVHALIAPSADRTEKAAP